MNVYNIKMENLTYTKGYYGNMPEEMAMNMQQKMRYDYMVNQLAWHHLDEVSKAEHMLHDSAQYKMHQHWNAWFATVHQHWNDWFARESNK